MLVKKYYSLVDSQFKYEAEGLIFPSVTNILKATKNEGAQAGIEYWKRGLISDLGLRKAQRKIDLPLKVGNYVHSVLEVQFKAFPDTVLSFEQSLAKHYSPALALVEEVIAVELPVYSKLYNYAGTVDAIVRLKDGRIAIFDHKTSNKKKSKSHVTDYFLQTAAYALAYYNMTGVVIDTTFVNIIYRQCHGKRKPTRFDSYEIHQLRLQVLAFLHRLDRYRLQTNFEEITW